MKCNWEITCDYFNKRLYPHAPNLCDIVEPLGRGLVKPIASEVDKETAKLIIKAYKALKECVK